MLLITFTPKVIMRHTPHK